MENRKRFLAQAISSPAPAVEASSIPPSAFDIDDNPTEAVELLVFEALAINDTREIGPDDQGDETSNELPGHLPLATSSHSAQCRSWADTEVPSQLFFDPADEVPVFLSVKFLHGYRKGNIYYHYLFPPPPVWNFPGHGKFSISDLSLLAVDKRQTKKSLLDRDAKGVLYLAKESIKIFYGNENMGVGLGPGKWLSFVTDYDGSEISIDTTFRRLIHRFLKSKPIAGSPLIITPIECYERPCSFAISKLRVLESNVLN